MAINSNLRGGYLNLLTGLPSGAWTNAAFVKVKDPTGGGLPSQGLFGFDTDATSGNEVSQFIFDGAGVRERWHTRNGGDSLGNVWNVVAGNLTWFFLAAIWDGASNVRYAWRRLDVASLSTAASALPGFNPSQFQIFRSFIFGLAYDVDAVGSKIWNAALSNEELLRESRQIQPARYTNLVTAYPLKDASSAHQSYNNLTLTLSGTLLSANNPDIPQCLGAAQ